MTSRKFSVIFLSAAEFPNQDNVATSQLLEVAVALKDRGIGCSWLSVLPLRMLRHHFKASNAIKSLEAKCRENGITWRHRYFGSNHFDSRMLRFHKAYCRVAAGLLRGQLRHLDLPGDIIINGRSYYATEIALALKEQLIRDGRRVIVCFDMRSLLSLSYPAGAPGDKFAAYGRLKAWEAGLAFRSDVIFNNRQPAIDLFRIEYGLEVTHLPVSGFSRHRPVEVDFAKKWEGRKIAFVGTLSSKYHSADLMRRLMFKLREAGFCPEVVTDAKAFTDPDFKVLRMPYENMHRYYSECLATLMPGKKMPDDVFDRLAIHIYTAPTKISESLSVGTPVIVGSCFRDISNFVRGRQCGLVYDSDQEEFLLPDHRDLQDRSLWSDLCDGAEAAGSIFTREQVVDTYIKTWTGKVDALAPARPKAAETALIGGSDA